MEYVELELTNGVSWQTGFIDLLPPGGESNLDNYEFQGQVRNAGTKAVLEMVSVAKDTTNLLRIWPSLTATKVAALIAADVDLDWGVLMRHITTGETYMVVYGGESDEEGLAWVSS